MFGCLKEPSENQLYKIIIMIITSQYSILIMRIHHSSFILSFLFLIYTHYFLKIKENTFYSTSVIVCSWWWNRQGDKRGWNWNKYLPSSFDAIKISAIEGSWKNPKLWKTKFVHHLNWWIPYVYCCLCPVHFLRRPRICDRMLRTTNL